MKKITEIKTERFVTRAVKDETGQRIKKQVRVVVNRPVELASNTQRIIHNIIDVFIFRFIIYLIDELAEYFNFWSYFPTKSAIVGVSVFILIYRLIGFAFYFFLFEDWLQATPGKLITKTVVIDEYGQKPQRKQLVIRSFARLVPFEAFSC